MDDNDVSHNERSKKLWDAIIQDSPFLKNYLGSSKAQIDAMTAEQRDNFLKAFMEVGKE